jgi:phosphoribosylformimino-5-aminoimidazole carboxamide ribotide isomerase
MLVIPAVDIRGGKCVRLIQGEFDKETEYSDDPVSMAVKWEKQGAKRLHVVDLDGARTGEMQNIETILKIASDIKIDVQTGGGIRDEKTAETLLDGGISRIIIGTAAVWNKDLLNFLFNKWPGRISVAVDSRDGKIADRGWQEITGERPEELAQEMERKGAAEIIVTDIKTDGMLKGPNVELMKEIADSVKISVIASGGVSCIDDIKKLKGLNLSNLTGVIVGKALYSGNIILSEAIEAGQGG